jgi:hypothetical protein
MTSRELKRLTATAYHEAGHAVAREQRGLRFRRVTIVPEDGALGMVESAGVPRWVYEETGSRHRIRGWYEDQIFVALAGPRAERRVIGRRNHVGAGGDYRWVSDLILRLGLPEAAQKPYLDYQIALLDGFLAVPYWWAKVEALAKALLDRKTLTGAEAREIFWSVCEVSP